MHPGDNVWLRDYSVSNDKWAPGRVVERLGTTDYKVVEASGKVSHRHIDQLKSSKRSSLVSPYESVQQQKTDEIGKPPDFTVDTNTELDEFQDCTEPPEPSPPPPAEGDSSDAQVQEPPKPPNDPPKPLSDTVSFKESTSR